MRYLYAVFLFLLAVMVLSVFNVLIVSPFLGGGTLFFFWCLVTGLLMGWLIADPLMDIISRG